MTARLAFSTLLLFSLRAADYSFGDAHQLLKTYCISCHQGKSPAGGFDMTQLAGAASLSQQPERWSRILTRVRNGEMPPKNLPAPAIEQRESLTAWIGASLK